MAILGRVGGPRQQQAQRGAARERSRLSQAPSGHYGGDPRAQTRMDTKTVAQHQNNTRTTRRPAVGSTGSRHGDVQITRASRAPAMPGPPAAAGPAGHMRRAPSKAASCVLAPARTDSSPTQATEAGARAQGARATHHHGRGCAAAAVAHAQAALIKWAPLPPRTSQKNRLLRENRTLGVLLMSR